MQIMSLPGDLFHSEESVPLRSEGSRRRRSRGPVWRFLSASPPQQPPQSADRELPPGSQAEVTTVFKLWGAWRVSGAQA